MISAVYIFAMLIAIIAQTTAFHLTRGAAPWPDLALTLVVYSALRMGKSGGVKMGLAAGFAEDILSGGAMGANTCAKGLIGFGVGKLREELISDSLMSRTLFTALATALDVVIYSLLSRTFTGNYVFVSIWATAFSMAAINALFAMPVMELMDRVDRWNRRMGQSQSGGKYHAPTLD